MILYPEKSATHEHAEFWANLPFCYFERLNFDWSGFNSHLCCTELHVSLFKSVAAVNAWNATDQVSTCTYCAKSFVFQSPKVLLHWKLKGTLCNLVQQFLDTQSTQKPSNRFPNKSQTQVFPVYFMRETSWTQSFCQKWNCEIPDFIGSLDLHLPTIRWRQR